jgi:hypothetical protein
MLLDRELEVGVEVGLRGLSLLGGGRNMDLRKVWFLVRELGESCGADEGVVSDIRSDSEARAGLL